MDDTNANAWGLASMAAPCAFIGGNHFLKLSHAADYSHAIGRLVANPLQSGFVSRTDRKAKRAAFGEQKGADVRPIEPAPQRDGR